MRTTKGYKRGYKKVMNELEAKIAFTLLRRNASIAIHNRRYGRYGTIIESRKIEGDTTAFSILSWVETWIEGDPSVFIIPFLGGRHLIVDDPIRHDESGFNGPLDGWGCDIYDDERIRRYHDMIRYESFDAFLSEHIKNSICEDNLGDIFSYL
jgi:hypothetical protein